MDAAAQQASPAQDLSQDFSPAQPGRPSEAQALDLSVGPVELTRAICDVESVSGNEARLADLVEAALGQLPHLRVDRDGDAVVARTDLGRGERVVLAGHLDTVPLATRPDGTPNLPVRLTGTGPDAVLHGRGTVDMKGGVGVQLHLAATLTEPTRDITFIFYDNEEVSSDRNGLGRLARNHPDWLAGDFAVLLEPTAGGVEGGCQGTMRVEVRTTGVAAHSARAWMGHNAIHDAVEVLQRLRDYAPREVDVEGLTFREGLNAVQISGGIAGNVIPDRCTVEVNYRFAPDRSVAEAEAHLREVFSGFDVTVTDAASAARPGLDRAIAAAFVTAVGREPKPKFGWTDVARFSELGVPAVNFGPGDPLLAHRDDEQCPVSQIDSCAIDLARWLS